ncbi:MAG: hypothetical protein IJS24_02365 [Eubacterium sp.]|nr:hypothetical protein [Eubacterium sp.]
MEKYERIICKCGKAECPYNKDHCCLGEIDTRCLNDDYPLIEKHCCKLKNSRKVIGILMMKK